MPVPDPVDCPLCLVDKHFIEPIPGQEGDRRKHPSHACFICNVSKEALSDAGFGTVTNPKSTPLTGVQYVSMHCVLILVLGYITLKRTTSSEIIKIARTSVKPIQKDAQHVQKDVQHVQKDVQHV